MYPEKCTYLYQWLWFHAKIRQQSKDRGRNIKSNFKVLDTPSEREWGPKPKPPLHFSCPHKMNESNNAIDDTEFSLGQPSQAAIFLTSHLQSKQHKVHCQPAPRSRSRMRYLPGSKCQESLFPVSGCCLAANPWAQNFPGPNLAICHCSSLSLVYLEIDPATPPAREACIFATRR